MFRRTGLPALLLGLCLAPAALGQYQATGKVTWNFDQTTTGSNVNWVSPTSVDPSAAEFNSTYALELVEIGWSYLFFSGTLDVTDQIPPEQLSSTGSVPGPAPLSLSDTAIVFPPPPEPVSISATVSVGLNGSGNGFFTATQVQLGTVPVNLGGIFGTVNVNITSIRVKGSLTMHATWFGLPGALAGTNGEPVMIGSGSLEPLSPGLIAVGNALPGATAYVVLGLSNLNAPFKGGTLVPFPDMFFALPVDAFGALVLPFTWPTGIPSRVPITMQTWVVDAGGPVGFAASNGVLGQTP